MAIREDLVYFLKNGKLENINFGITRKDLFQLVGEPESWQTDRTKYNAELYFYNNFEFYFEDKTKDSRLIYIQVNYPSSYSRKGSLIFRSYNWTTNLTIEKAKKFLNKHKIKVEKKSNPVDADIFCCLETESGVKIFFTNQNDDETTWTLYSFGKAVELISKKTPTKQVSFEIEKKFYEQLREKAENTKTSIANLCREIVEKHLENNN
jgi:hypothetical protein